MKKFMSIMKNFAVKHGSAIVAVAFAFVTIAANSSCCIPYYEPQEPTGINRFKKFSK